jgi:hypothetical protein
MAGSQVLSSLRLHAAEGVVETPIEGLRLFRISAPVEGARRLPHGHLCHRAGSQAHARARPWEPHKYASKEAQDANLDMLLGWIADYPSREGPLGRAAHEALFEGFTGRKERRVRRTSADSGL